MAWGAVIGAVGAGLSLMQGSSSAERARRIGRLNAQAIRDESREESRRMVRELQTAYSSMTAGAGASGLDTQSKSFQEFRRAQREEGNRQLAWIKKSSDNRQAIARAGGDAAASSATNQGIMGAFSSIASGFGGS